MKFPGTGPDGVGSPKCGRITGRFESSLSGREGVVTDGGSVLSRYTFWGTPTRLPSQYGVLSDVEGKKGGDRRCVLKDVSESEKTKIHVS